MQEVPPEIRRLLPAVRAGTPRLEPGGNGRGDAAGEPTHASAISGETVVIAGGIIAICVVMVGFVLSRTSRQSYPPAMTSAPAEDQTESPVSYGTRSSDQPQTVYVPVPTYGEPAQPGYPRLHSVTSPIPQKRYGPPGLRDQLNEIEAINRFNRENQQRMLNPGNGGARFDPWGRPVQQPGTPGPYGY